MDPVAAIAALMRGHMSAEHARAYNEWRRGQGFAALVYLPESMRYELGRNVGSTTMVSVDRVYRGHRGWRARCERHGGQGFVTVNVSDLTLTVQE
jgi:hypothetical protein